MGEADYKGERTMATMRVKHKGFPDPITIEAEDFDPAIHKEVASESGQKGDADLPAVTPNPELRGRLPEDFPARDALESAGITTYGQARKVTDWTTIKGVGAPTEAKIKVALAAKSDVSDE
jgi:hypothetical protein